MTAPRLPHAELAGTDGRRHDLAAEAASSRALVVTFFSRNCPCQAAHDARLKALAATWQKAGVAFVAVDAEDGATLARDEREARDRGYPFPILTDPSAELAAALGAEVATYSVVFDASGIPRYRGGIDSDWIKLTEDAEPWLDKAISRVVRGADPSIEEHRALGCALRRP